MSQTLMEEISMRQFTNSLSALLAGVALGLLANSANATIYTSANVPVAIPDAGAAATTP